MKNAKNRENERPSTHAQQLHSHKRPWMDPELTNSIVLCVDVCMRSRLSSCSPAIWQAGRRAAYLSSSLHNNIIAECQCCCYCRTTATLEPENNCRPKL